jgi:hypothetical protein
MLFAKVSDRVMATQRVQCYQKITGLPVVLLLYSQMVAQSPDEPCPPISRDAVTIPCIGGCRRDKFDLQWVLLLGAGAKSSPHVTPVGSIKVSPGISNEK